MISAGESSAEVGVLTASLRICYRLYVQQILASKWSLSGMGFSTIWTLDPPRCGQKCLIRHNFPFRRCRMSNSQPPQSIRSTGKKRLSKREPWQISRTGDLKPAKHHFVSYSHSDIWYMRPSHGCNVASFIPVEAVEQTRCIELIPKWPGACI